MPNVSKRDEEHPSRRCPKCRRSMRLAKTVHWAFHDWLACPHCDTYVKPSYYEAKEAARVAA